jgi:hypothetical protein
MDKILILIAAWRKARAEKRAVEFAERAAEMNALCDSLNHQLDYYHRKGWRK